MNYINGLTRINDSTYKGYQLFTEHGPFIKQYLDINEEVLGRALIDHPRTIAVRIDLRIPFGGKDDPAVISRFFEAMNEKIQISLNSRVRKGQRRRRCNLRYVWAREQENSINEHYHIAIFLNKDCYIGLGEMSVFSNGLFGCVCASWARATGWPLTEIHRFVYVPANAVYLLDANSKNIAGQSYELLKRLGYMAKEKSKTYGNRKKSYSCSRR